MGKVQSIEGRSIAKREVQIVASEVAVLDTAKFDQMQRIATAMAGCSIIPDHLIANPWWWRKNMSPADIAQQREKLGEEAFQASRSEANRRTMANCFLVVNQAVRWEMDPFAIAPETYVVGGKLGYQGKLVAAVVNARAGLERRLDYRFSGSGLDRKVEVIGHFKGETEPRVIELTVGQAKTDNQMWKKDPDQKLIYSAVTKWARRWCPEIVLGVLTDDDLERIARQRGVVTEDDVLEVLATDPPEEVAAEPAEATVEPAEEAPVEHAAQEGADEGQKELFDAKEA